MKRFFQVIIFSFSTIFAATIAFAAPHEDRHLSSQQPQIKSDAHKATSKQPDQHRSARDLKVGDKLPASYRSQSYRVNDQQYRLPKPSNNQKWLKIHNDYVLIDTSNYTIIRVVNR